MNEITIARNEESGTITASIKYKGHANDMSIKKMNENVSLLLNKLAQEIANENQYEFNGISEVSFEDEVMELELHLFIP